MLPVFHSARVMPCLIDGPTMSYAESRFLRATAVLINCCASFLTSAGTWMFFSGFVTSTAGSFENVSLGSFAVLPTNTAIAAIAPANNIRPATHGRAFRQKGTWRVALEGRGLGLVVVLIRLGMVDGRWLRKVRASRKNARAD